MIECPSCDRVSDPTPTPGTPCPGCGTPLVEEPSLEVDAEWAASKAATQAAHAAPKKKASTFARMSLGIALLAVIGVIAVMIAQRSPFARGGAKANEGVRITITAARPTKITIDGRPAGTTPVTMQFQNGNRPIRIEGGGRSSVVTPDRDRVVDLR